MRFRLFPQVSFIYWESYQPPERDTANATFFLMQLVGNFQTPTNIFISQVLTSKTMDYNKSELHSHESEYFIRIMIKGELAMKDFIISAVLSNFFLLFSWASSWTPYSFSHRFPLQAKNCPVRLLPLTWFIQDPLK